MDPLTAAVLVDDLEDEELFIMYELDRKMNEIQRNPMFRLDLENMSNDECKLSFRFEKDDIFKLKDIMQFPNNFTGYNGSKCTGLEGLCLMLRRLAYPNRLYDIAGNFGMNITETSILFNETVSFVYNNYNQLLVNYNQPWMTIDHLLGYCQAIRAKDAPLVNCYGFIDGTARPIARPTIGQRHFFSGHYRQHCLKFQSIVIPNGLVTNLYGPVEGSRHDSAMLRRSGILDDLQLKNLPNGESLCLYGDPAYPKSPYLLAPFRGPNITAAEQRFNKLMSSVRESVEWGFGKIVNQFAFLDFEKNLKVLLSPIGKLYKVGTILTNAHTCLYGSEINQFFNMDAPRLEYYLHR